ncbi:hypothetical protein ACKI2N_029125 [Cupriavidus sp. 30B13]|uniref:hypothetical protein n=1 Tax=Cupriavidus sp. 30B13 TaxID=3384241 RepID=UPI003B904BC6
MNRSSKTARSEDDKPVPGRAGTATRAQDPQGGAEPRLPHEHDESHHSQDSGPRKEVEQAGRDIERGLEDTDLYRTRGKRTGRQQ